jgi:MoxR-like ATPase
MSKAVKTTIQDIIERTSQSVFDKKTEISLAYCCILAEGHLLIEDVPGVGKTLLAKTMSQLLGLEFSRIQFTNDMLASDIIGSSVFDSQKNKFTFVQGPIFSQVVLGDELNRATPKAQSAFMQALEERSISVDRETYALPRPFIFIATQNPNQQIGTFPLPESQLDRFLMRLSLGFPSPAAEERLLSEATQSRIEKSHNKNQILNEVQLSPAQVLSMQDEVRSITATDAIVKYALRIISATRNSKNANGASPRASLGLIRAAQAWAYISDRPFVIPEDLQAVAVSVLNHRMNLHSDTSNISGNDFANEIIQSVSVDAV